MFFIYNIKKCFKTKDTYKYSFNHSHTLGIVCQHCKLAKDTIGAPWIFCSVCKDVLNMTCQKSFSVEI